MTAALTGQLVDFTCTPPVTGDDVLVEAATAAVVDSISVVLAGAGSEVSGALHRYVDAVTPAGKETSRWTGFQAGLAPDLMALVTATLGHALDFDDALPGAGHPSVILLSTATSLPVEKLPGNLLLDAFAVGFEVNARVAKAVGHKHYLHGWHTTATVCCFGATATAARVLRLSPVQVARAYGITASLAAGLQRNFGTFTKPLHSGFAARVGVMAALMARAGMTADESILDGDRGFLAVYAQGAQQDDALQDLGRRWSLVQPGTTQKKYPCALETFRAVDGLLELQARHGIAAADILGISAVLPPGTLGPLRYPRPQDEMQAKFSMPYVLAAAALDGTLSNSSFTNVAIARPEVARLMDCVHLREDVANRPEDPSGRNSSASFGGFVDVEVTTAAGTVSARVHHPVGSPQRPLSAADRTAKFLDCAVFGGRDADVASEVLPELRRLSQVPDVHDVLDRLTPTHVPVHFAPEGSPRS